MADILIEREHSLGLERALSRIEAIAELLRGELDAQCAWNGNRLDFKRAGASGSVEVTETALTLEVNLGFLLKPFKGAIEQAIAERIDGSIPCRPPV